MMISGRRGSSGRAGAGGAMKEVVGGGPYSSAGVGGTIASGLDSSILTIAGGGPYSSAGAGAGYGA